MMQSKSKRTTSVTIRMPNRELALIDTYAKVNNLSRSQAIVHYLREGFGAEKQAQLATKDDLLAIAGQLQHSIDNQPVVVQSAAEPPALPDPDAWKSKSLIDRILRR